MRYPEGYRTLYNTRTGREFVENLTPLTSEDVDDINVGSKLIVLPDRRSKQWIYEVTEVKETAFILRRLTPTGKVSTAQNSKIRVRKDQCDMANYTYDLVYKPYEFEYMMADIQRYLEDTKDDYVCKGKNRDSQRQRVYDAEDKMRKKLGKGKQFKNEREANQWLHSLMCSSWFNETFPDFNHYGLRIKVNNRYKHKCVASYGKEQIIVAGNSLDFGLNEVVMGHELAHFTAQGAQHNAPFTTNFIKILEHLNEDLAKELRYQYKRHNVEF